MNKLESDVEFYRLLEKYAELEEEINQRIDALCEILGYEVEEDESSCSL